MPPAAGRPGWRHGHQRLEARVRALPGALREGARCVLLSGGVAGLSPRDMRQYLQYCADQRLAQLGMPRHFGATNPFAFMDLQDVQEVTNFFERRVSAYQVGVQGEVAFDAAF